MNVTSVRSFPRSYRFSTKNGWKSVLLRHIYLNCGERYEDMIDHRSYKINVFISFSAVHVHSPPSTGKLRTHNLTSFQIAQLVEHCADIRRGRLAMSSYSINEIENMYIYLPAWLNSLLKLFKVLTTNKNNYYYTGQQV